MVSPDRGGTLSSPGRRRALKARDKSGVRVISNRGPARGPTPISQYPFAVELMRVGPLRGPECECHPPRACRLRSGARGYSKFRPFGADRSAFPAAVTRLNAEFASRLARRRTLNTYHVRGCSEVKPLRGLRGPDSPQNLCGTVALGCAWGLTGTISRSGRRIISRHSRGRLCHTGSSLCVERLTRSV